MIETTGADLKSKHCLTLGLSSGRWNLFKPSSLQGVDLDETTCLGRNRDSEIMLSGLKISGGRILQFNGLFSVWNTVGQQLKFIINFGAEIGSTLLDTTNHEISSFSLRLIKNKSIPQIPHRFWFETRKT